MGHRTLESGGRTPTSYLAGHSFKSLPMDRLLLLSFSWSFTVTSGKCQGSNLKYYTT